MIIQNIPIEVNNVFKDRFASEPDFIRSPGRVNLIGDHTDYNQGFVLPAAIDRSVYLAIAPNRLGKIRAYALNMPDSGFEYDITASINPVDRRWPNYFLGVVYLLKRLNHNIRGFDSVIGSNVPIGAGLSSSAALEGALLTAVNRMEKLGLSKIEMAKLGQQVEHSFIGVQCGIMDQFANLYGSKDRLIKLDCNSLQYERIPFDNRNYRLVLCDTNVHRELAGSEYNLRREQCEQGVAYFASRYRGISSLRDITENMLESHKSNLDSIIYNRCRFVLDENSRVLHSCEDLERNDFRAFGQRMFESHYGLRDLYDVSCRELDILVEEAKTMEGVYGARMMGGGFGGCTINLVRKEVAGDVSQKLAERFKRKTSVDPEVYIVKTADGTGTYSINERKVY